MDRGAHGNEEKAPRPVVEDDQQRIDPGRRMEAVGQVHDDHGDADGDGRCPGLRARDRHRQEPDRGGEQMAPDERAAARALLPASP
jgi:hypothetical protein